MPVHQLVKGIAVAFRDLSHQIKVGLRRNGDSPRDFCSQLWFHRTPKFFRTPSEIVPDRPYLTKSAAVTEQRSSITGSRSQPDVWPDLTPLAGCSVTGGCRKSRTDP